MIQYSGKPTSGTIRISSSQAVDEDGRRFSGTVPIAYSFSPKSSATRNGATRSVRVIGTPFRRCAVPPGHTSAAGAPRLEPRRTGRRRDGTDDQR